MITRCLITDFWHIIAERAQRLAQTSHQDLLNPLARLCGDCLAPGVVARIDGVQKVEVDRQRARPCKHAAGVGDAGIVLAKAVPVEQLPGFWQGAVSVQDSAAQMAAPLLLDGLSARAGQSLRVLDACAAPGGKTAHLLEMAPPGDMQVVALEIDAKRAQRIGETLERLGLAADIVVASATDVAAWLPQVPHGVRQFDAVLLDAPCSASGIVRRQPDVRWLRRATDIAQLAAIQKQLLEALWPLVAPGGRLLYCTCSVFYDEGEGQIVQFLRNHADAQRLPAPGHLLPQQPQVGDNSAGSLGQDHDGFYYALLQKPIS